MQESEIAREILGYLVKHPGAQDTLEGITQWWIPEQRIRTQIGNVKKAIAELVAQKFVIERKGKDSRTHYRINPRKIMEIKDFQNRRHCLVHSSHRIDWGHKTDGPVNNRSGKLVS